MTDQIHTPTDRDPHAVAACYVTADIPGVGGVLKQRPEDFLVEETPLYDPRGEGEHLYLFVEKRELSTQQLISILAAHFGVRRSAIGYAGMKDKMAITRQVLSIHLPGKKIEDFPMIRHDRISVLWADYHANKLRVGHLRGNRFSIRVRGVEMSGILRAKRILERLAALGAPNRIGEQRFGILQNNHLIGRAMIAGDFDAAVRELVGPSARFPDVGREPRALFARGEYAAARDAHHHSSRAERAVLHGLVEGLKPARALLRLDPVIKGFFLSAFQSAVFNAVLDQRVRNATFGALLLGDLACKHANGAVFPVDEAVLADPTTPDRLRSFDISPSGPIWGVSMARATGPVDEAEVQALERTGVTLDDLRRFDATNRDLINGVRRLLRIPVLDPEVEGGVDEHGPYIRCAFELPRGAFATVVMAEVMKTATQPAPEDEEEQ